MSGAGRPRATYRLQLNKAFGFADVGALAPYLGRLGVSHAYLSPVLKARPGSTHGYDTVDHTRLNPELGSLEDFRAMSAALREQGVGIVLDIVPNHMGIAGDQNRLWLDVLERGQASPYADWFDIDWTPAEASLQGRVLVPFLGKSYGQALRQGGLELRFDADEGSFAVWLEGTLKLPLAVRSYAEVLAGIPALADLVAGFAAPQPHTAAAAPRLKAELARRCQSPLRQAVDAAVAAINADPAALDGLVALQHWRPARFTTAADDLNYRRFFVVSELAALRVENPEVFEHVHRLVFSLVAEGLVDGLRVDHVDGLYDPEDYCRKLRQAAPKPIYLVVEKILAPNEWLRPSWGVDGTTGYEFSSRVMPLLSDSDGEPTLTQAYRTFAGPQPDLDTSERQGKRDIMDFEMAAELNALAVGLRRLAVRSTETTDLSRNALRLALRGYLESLPVYRTYLGPAGLDRRDRRLVEFALARARKSLPALDPGLFGFLGAVLRGELAGGEDLARRIEQFSGPVMAKGLEDTALYRANLLIALSDVGERPDRFSAGVDSFHDFCRARQLLAPGGMLASSSHDSKRAEDARARIVALSGCAAEWGVAVTRWWSELRTAGAPDIDRNDAWSFFQLLLGSWPAAFGPDTPVDPAAMAAFRERLQAAMQKSVREARLHSNWINPNTDYESRILRFVETASSHAGFLADFRAFEARIAWWGAANGLVATTLKLTVPGVPDIYQGSETWAQSMVDPDNRRAVDFARHAEALAAGPAERDDWRDGACKQALISRLLACRKRSPELFASGSYEPLATADDGLVVFVRRERQSRLLVAARLYPWRRRSSDTLRLSLPDRGRLEPVFGDASVGPGEVSLGFDRWPIAVLANI